MNDIQPFLNQVLHWAERHTDILAVALVGSHARGAAREDSDIDLVILAASPRVYLDNPGWVEEFGEIERQQSEDYGKLVSLRAWYRDGSEVEFGLTDRTWAASPLDEGTRRVIADGMRILFEREPILTHWEKYAGINQL